MQHLVVLQVMQQANGITFRARDIYTAVPGTRTGGDFSSEEIIASSELPCSASAQQAETLALPGRHHRTDHPRDNGSQPPETIYRGSREQRNINAGSHQHQTDKQLVPVPVLRATVADRMEVSTMVPVTAIRRRQVR